MTLKRWALLSVAAVAVLLLAATVFDERPDTEGTPSAESTPVVEDEPTRRPPRKPRKDLLDAAEPEPSTAEADTTTAEPAAASSLRVIVVADESDEPIEGARVTLEPSYEAPDEVITGPDGVALFEPAPSVSFDVAAFAPGRARVRGFGWVDEIEPGKRQDLTLRLIRGLRLTGRVLDLDGRPLDDVRVDLHEGGSLGGVSSSSGGPPLGATKSDRAGGFVFDGVPKGEIVTVHLLRPGYAYTERALRLAGGGGDAPMEIRLAPGGAVAGFVRGPDQRPLEGARILVVPSGAGHLLDDPNAHFITAGGTSQSRPLQGWSDEQGRFLVHGLSLDAPYTAMASVLGMGRSDRQRGLVARAGATTVVTDLRVRRLVSLHVRVVDADGKPIEGASVLCFSGEFRDIPEGPDGTFEVMELGPGRVGIDVDADGYVKQRVTHTMHGREGEELEVRLERGLAITGIAVNDAGEPLAEARIRAMRPLGSDLPSSLADTLTDAEGRFAVGGLNPGTHMVLCWASDHDRGKLDPVEAGARDVRVVALRHGQVKLTLRPPEGSPTPARVSISKRRREGGGSGTEMGWPEEGRFEVGVAPGGMTLVLHVDGYADLPFDIDLAPGATLDLGNLSLDAGSTLTGRIVDLAGEPVAGAEVRATASWNFEGALSQTDADGRYRVEKLSRAGYSVQISARGFLEQEHEWEIAGATEEHDLTLARGGVVLGRVVTKEGVGVSDGTVWLVALGVDDPDEASDFCYPENSGKWAVRVPPGKYRVEYRPEEGEPVVAREFDLVEGSRETVDFTVDP